TPRPPPRRAVVRSDPSMLLLPQAARPSRGLPSSRTRRAPRTLSVTTQGRILVLLALVAFSFSGVLARAVYATGAEPLSLLVIRFTTAAIALSLLSRRSLLAI